MLNLKNFRSEKEVPEVVFLIGKRTHGKDGKIYFTLEQNGEHVALLIIQHPELILGVGELSYLQRVIRIRHSCFEKGGKVL